MSALLHEIVTHKRDEIEQRKAQVSLADLKRRPLLVNRDRFYQALQGPRDEVKLILEVKPASPSAGVLCEDLDLDALLTVYNQHASAVSVLTDQRYFQGSLALLSQVLEQTFHPVLCKDFIVDPYQVYEAALAGASAVLLIVKILDDARLRELTELAQSLGLEPLIEIQNETELERALTVQPRCLLINNRNLETFEISLETTRRLVPLIPSALLPISASGITTRQDIESLKFICPRFLIGTALMRQPVSLLSETLKELHP